MNTMFSKHNMKLLMQEDIRAFVLFNRMACNIKGGNTKTALEVVTVEVTKAEMYEMFHKNIVKSLLDKLEDLCFIKRVNQSQRNNHYYINPHVIHSLNSNQREEYVKLHRDLIPDKPDVQVSFQAVPGVPNMGSSPYPSPVPIPLPPVMSNYQPGQTPLPE